MIICYGVLWAPRVRSQNVQRVLVELVELVVLLLEVLAALAVARKSSP